MSLATHTSIFTHDFKVVGEDDLTSQQVRQGRRSYSTGQRRFRPRQYRNCDECDDVNPTRAMAGASKEGTALKRSDMWNPTPRADGSRLAFGVHDYTIPKRSSSLR
jgi:hypothetical protein